MALVNPNIALGVRQPEFTPRNAMAEYAQMQQIMNAQDTQQMNALKMQEARFLAENRNSLRGLNFDAPDYVSQVAKYDPKLASEIAKERATIASQQAAARASGAAADKSGFELTNLRRKFGDDLKRGLSANPSDENIIAFGQDAVLQNLYPKDQVEATVRQLLALPPAERVRILSQSGASPSELKPTTNVGPTGIVQTPAFGGTATVVPGTGAAFQMTPAQIEQGKRDQQRLAFEGQRVGLEGQRIGLEGRRVGLEGQRVDIARQEAERKTQGLEALPPKEIQKREAVFPQATSSVKSIETKSDQFITELEKLRDDPGLDQITGPIYGRTPSVSRAGSRAQALYDKIFAKGGFQALQDMREASKTGGALGNVSNEEGRRLEKSVVGGLDRTQNIADVKQGINDLIQEILVSKSRVREAYDSTYSYKSGGGASSAKPAGGATGNWSVVR